MTIQERVDGDLDTVLALEVSGSQGPESALDRVVQDCLTDWMG